MSKEYFARCERFKKGLSKRINKFLKDLCKECPSQEDTHGMNCIECCPLHGVLGKMMQKAQRKSK